MRRGRATGPKGALKLHPPQIRANVELTHRYRFTSSSGTAKTITDSLLMGAAGALATSTTVGAPLYQAVKLKRVSIWTPPASQGAAASCSILWAPGNIVSGGRGTEVSDTTVSVAEPAHVTSVPPRGSVASFWQNGNTGQALMQLVAPSGSIIDVELQLVLADGAASLATPLVLVGATAGAVYYGALDNTTKASAVYLPVSLTSL